MATNKTTALGVGSRRIAHKPDPKTWQVTLVPVRRRDAALRLAQIYQLLLNGPQTNSVLQTSCSSGDRRDLESSTATDH